MQALGQKYGEKVTSADMNNKKSYATYKSHIKQLKIPEKRKRSADKTSNGGINGK